MSIAQSVRDRLSFMRGNMLVLTIIQVTGMFCRSMVFPYRSLYILALGGQPAQIGWINSLSPLAGLIMFPIGGYLADRVSRVKLISLAAFLQGAIIFLYVIASSWQVIAIAALLQGFVVFQFPATSAIIADSLTPATRGVGMATMNSVSGIPAMLSPYVAGIVIDNLGPNKGIRILYVVMMVVYLANAALQLFTLKDTTTPSGEKLSLSSVPGLFMRAYGSIPSLLRQFSPALRALALVIVLGFTSNAITGAFWVVYAVEHIGLSTAQWGSILLIETFVRTVLYIPAGVLADRFGRTGYLIGALVLAAIAVPSFVFCTTYLHVLLARAAIGVVNAFLNPSCSALMADMMPKEIRGRAMSACGRGTFFLGASSGGAGGPGMGYLITIPVMIGSLASGYLYAYHPASPWFVALGLLVAGVLLCALFIRDPQEAHA